MSPATAPKVQNMTTPEPEPATSPHKSPMRPRRRSKAWLWILLAVLAAGGGTALLMTRSHSQAPEGEIVKVARGPVQVTVQEVGSIEPFRKIEIKAKVAGQVLQVYVDVGDTVKAGDTLMKLDPLDAERDTKQAEARAQISEAQLQEQVAQNAFKKKAHDQGALSDSEWAIAEGEVKRMQAQLVLDRETTGASRDRLSYTNIKSPIAGVVLARNVQPGEMVTPGVASMVDGKPSLVVAQMDKLLVRTELNQIDVARLKAGGKVEIAVDALPDQKFTGEIYRIAAMALKSERRKDSNLQVFPVDIVVSRSEKGAEALRPGMMADITIDIDKHDNVLFVPVEAIVREGAKTSIWKIVGDKQPDTSVPVTLGLQNDRMVEIVSGVSEGDSIRVRPADATSQTVKM